MSSVKKQGTYQVLPLNVGLSDDNIASNIAIYNQLVIDRNRLLENSTTANPLVQNITDQITKMRSSVIQSLQKTQSALKISIGTITGEQNRLSGRFLKFRFRKNVP
ncbi:hypothetical protein [Chryseobacterium indoltheticum]|uniref:hypothetical protein n=1 Tax=Chryseobacterium indoltheticum TaxID=254 RepID=UPI003F492770